jgi:hypothetical protein
MILTPALCAGQSRPTLVPIPVAAPLAQLDFKLDIAAPLVVHPSGCVALFDEDADQVVCVDPTSGTTHRFGRQGEGPGEFRSTRSMTTTPDGGMLVFDWKNARLTTITRDWKLGGTTPLTQNLTLVRPATADSVLALGGKREYELLSVSLHDGKSAVRFAPALGDSAGIFQGPHDYDYGLWLAPRKPGGWFVVGAWKYQILIEDDHGTKQSAFGRTLPPELPSAREVSEMRTWMARAIPGAMAAVDRLTAEWAKTSKAAITHAPAVDGDGRLWVVTGRVRADSTELDAFDASGKFLGTFRVSGAVDALAIRGHDLYVIVEFLSGENDGAQGVVRYKIRA